MPLELIASELSLERGGRRLQTGLGLRAVGGTALLLTGPNGTGKTTLLRTIAGFIRPAAGTIRLLGGSAGDADRAIGERCHLIGHLNAVKPGLTVLENARFWAAFLGTMAETTDTAVAAALVHFRLDGLLDVPAGYLSAGQKRRLGLSRLLLAARPVWLLDEPTVSLDKDSTATLADLANGHLAAGGIVIAATHLPLGLSPATELALKPLDTPGPIVPSAEAPPP
jgi:heme exporter protein A